MAEAIPANPKRILLVDPSPYLGNFLLAGGLIQQFIRFCEKQGTQVRIVLDTAFAPLCRNNLPEACLIWYPRTAMRHAGIRRQASLYRDCLHRIRAFRADIAFTIEEESAAGWLTRLSGARFRLGCSPRKHRRGFDRVLAVEFENRPAAERHRWYSYADVFAALGMQAAGPGYLAFGPRPLDDALADGLRKAGLDLERPMIAIHAGATKDYKKWPLEHFIALVNAVAGAGWQAVLLGAGHQDRDANAAIRQATARAGHTLVDLCDKLDLSALADLLSRCRYMVGNDSGPSHLASALGIPGSVIFGPSQADIWGPLGSQTRVFRKAALCAPDCSKAHCTLNRRCLAGITPDEVFAGIRSALDT